MIERRKFLAGVTQFVSLTGLLGVLGLVGGCNDTPTEAPAQTAEQAAAAKEAQNKMKEFLAKKGASPAQKKR